MDTPDTFKQRAVKCPTCKQKVHLVYRGRTPDDKVLVFSDHYVFLRTKNDKISGSERCLHSREEPPHL